MGTTTLTTHTSVGCKAESRRDKRRGRPGICTASRQLLNCLSRIVVIMTMTVLALCDTRARTAGLRFQISHCHETGPWPAQLAIIGYNYRFVLTGFCWLYGCAPPPPPGLGRTSVRMHSVHMGNRKASTSSRCIWSLCQIRHCMAPLQS